MKQLSQRASFFILCTIGCVYQMTTVTFNYFQFKVRTEITYEYPMVKEIPDIDIRMYISNLINMSAVYLVHPKELTALCYAINGLKNVTLDSVEKFNKHCSSLNESATLTSIHLLSFLTIGDIENFTIEPRTMITGMWLRADDIDLLKEKYCSIVKYIEGMYIHLRISCQNNSKPMSIQISQTGQGLEYIMCVIMENVIKFQFKLSEFNTSLNREKNNYKPVDVKSNCWQFVSVESHRTVTRSLPWPYETMCKHYDKSSVFINCINRILLSSLKPAIYYDTVFPFYKYHASWKFTGSEHIKHNRTAFEAIFKKCEAKAIQQECYSVIHHSTAFEHCDYPRSEDLKKQSHFCLKRPVEPDTLVSVHPSSDLIDYLIYMSSTLGLWFGVSIYGQLNDHSHKMTILVNKMARNPRKLWHNLVVNSLRSKRIKVTRISQVNYNPKHPNKLTIASRDLWWAEY